MIWRRFFGCGGGENVLNNSHEFKTGSIQMSAAPVSAGGCRREGVGSTPLTCHHGGSEALHPNGEGA